MAYEPDEYMSQPDGKIILEKHIKYIKQNDGTLSKKLPLGIFMVQRITKTVNQLHH